MKIFNFKNHLVQYLKEDDLNKIFKYFKKPDKVFALTSIEKTVKSAIWDFENLDTDVEFLIVETQDANKIFDEVIMMLKEAVEEEEIDVNNLEGIAVSIYQVSEEHSVLIYSDLQDQLNSKLLVTATMSITNNIVEYIFAEIYTTKEIENKINRDIKNLIFDKIFIKKD